MDPVYGTPSKSLTPLKPSSSTPNMLSRQNTPSGYTRQQQGTPFGSTTPNQSTPSKGSTPVAVKYPRRK